MDLLQDEAPAAASASLPAIAGIRTLSTDQCALHAPPEQDFRVDLLVAEGDKVAQGAPVARSRREPGLILCAPVAGEVAAIDIGPGRRLAQIRFFHLPEVGRYAHMVPDTKNPTAIRALLLSAGLWPRLRSRPYGRIPAVGELPAAIVVMAVDTRPHAPPPRLALDGREEDFARGLRAIEALTEGTVFVCQQAGESVPPAGAEGRRRTCQVKPVHPHGLPGFQVLQHCAARMDRTVWDIHAEDVADIGALLATGLVPEARLVSVSGSALRESRLVRCQLGADLRALTFDLLKPGPHRLLSGSVLDGTPGRWLGRWHRQVTAVADPADDARKHWFSAALGRAGRPLPIIPTAALDHAFGGILPAAALVRALSANDAETAVRLGALSLVEEDVALADWVTGASPKLATMLRAMLDHAEQEAG